MSTHASPGFVRRMLGFMDIIFEPKQHLLFAALWFLSLQGTMVLLGPAPPVWRIGPATLVGVATLFLVLFYLRAIDEVKDLEYDRVYNPDRPLAAGVVSTSDIRLTCKLCAAMVSLINLPLAAGLVLFLWADMGYGLLLIVLEKKLPPMQKSLFFNLAVTYPVSIALSFYTLLHTAWVVGVPVGAPQLAAIGAYILAFLHFEIIRKTVWPHLAEEGERFYSQEIGGAPALALGMASGIAAVALMLALTRPWAQTGAAAITGWLPLLALGWASASLTRALRNRYRRTNPRPFAVAFIGTFYLTNLIHALVAM